MILWALFFNFILLLVFYVRKKNILCSPDKTRSFGVWCNFRQLKIIVLTKILSYNFMILSSANFYMLTRLNCEDKKKYVLDFRCFRCFRFYFCNIDYILNETNNEALQVKHVFELIAVVTLRTYYYYHYYFSFICRSSTS